MRKDKSKKVKNRQRYYWRLEILRQPLENGFGAWELFQGYDDDGKLVLSASEYMSFKTLENARLWASDLMANGTLGGVMISREPYGKGAKR